MNRHSSCPRQDRRAALDLRPALLAAGLAATAFAISATPADARSLKDIRSLSLTQSWPDRSGESVILVEQARQLSLREVVQIIEARVPGRLSDARLVDQGGRSVYLIRWEPSDEAARGRVIEFVVDAETGAILSRRG